MLVQPQLPSALRSFVGLTHAYEDCLNSEPGLCTHFTETAAVCHRSAKLEAVEGRQGAIAAAVDGLCKDLAAQGERIDTACSQLLQVGGRAVLPCLPALQAHSPWPHLRFHAPPAAACAALRSLTPGCNSTPQAVQSTADASQGAEERLLQALLLSLKPSRPTGGASRSGTWMPSSNASDTLAPTSALLLTAADMTTQTSPVAIIAPAAANADADASAAAAGQHEQQVPAGILRAFNQRRPSSSGLQTKVRAHPFLQTLPYLRHSMQLCV